MATTRKTTTTKTATTKTAAQRAAADDVDQVDETTAADPAGAAVDEDDDESLSAQIVAEDKPATKPAGSPQMVPLSALPRRVRGEFQRAWMEPFPDEVIQQMSEGGSVNETDLMKSADMIRNAGLVVAAQEDALRLVAFSTPAFDAWAGKVTDEEISDLFAWYQGRYGSGE